MLMVLFARHRCCPSFGPEHGRDYLAGRGGMMRYLGNDEARKLIDVDLTENIEKTVHAIWEDP